MLSMYIAPISTGRDKNEMTSFKQKISLRKSVPILGLDHHGYVNRELVHVIMAAINLSAITARCKELVCTMGHPRACQQDSRAVEDH